MQLARPFDKPSEFSFRRAKTSLLQQPKVLKVISYSIEVPLCLVRGSLTLADLSTKSSMSFPNITTLPMNTTIANVTSKPCVLPKSYGEGFVNGDYFLNSALAYLLLQLLIITSASRALGTIKYLWSGICFWLAYRMVVCSYQRAYGDCGNDCRNNTRSICPWPNSRCMISDCLFLSQAHCLSISP